MRKAEKFAEHFNASQKSFNEQKKWNMINILETYVPYMGCIVILFFVHQHINIS